MSNEEVIKNKRGRKKGEGPIKKLGPDEIHKAKISYISGKSIPEIGKEMGLTSMNTLYRHMKKDNWEAEKNSFFEKSAEGQLNAIFSSNVAETELALMDLNAIREASMNAITQNKVAPKRFSEASNAYVDALNASMKIRAEALQLNFIMEVGQILKEEIRDQDTLIRISNRLREAFKIKQNKLLASPE